MEKLHLLSLSASPGGYNANLREFDVVKTTPKTVTIATSSGKTRVIRRIDIGMIGTGMMRTDLHNFRYKHIWLIVNNDYDIDVAISKLVGLMKVEAKKIYEEAHATYKNCHDITAEVTAETITRKKGEDL